MMSATSEHEAMQLPSPSPSPSPSQTISNGSPHKMQSKLSPQQQNISQTQLQAPPQPPLPLSDPAFTAPPIVNGIDPDEELSPSSQTTQEQPITPFLSRDGMSNVFANLSASVSRVMRVSKTEVTRAVESVASPIASSSIDTNAMEGNTKPSTHIISEIRTFSQQDFLPVICPSVLLFGDSITQYASRIGPPDGPGWATLLRDAYATSVDVYLRGFSGYNTRWALRMFPRITAGLPPVSAVVMFFGANDAAKPGEEQHVPLAEYKHNLATMVRYVQNDMPSNPTPILITPPPLSAKRYETDNKRDTETTAMYAEACVEVARRHDCAVVDLHTAITQKAESEGQHIDEFLIDGLHLSDEGNKIVFELLNEIMLECAPQVAPALVERPFPDYKLLDEENLDECLGPTILK